MNDNIYDFMKKWQHIDLGQVFTPIHMARFAAKLIDINKDDKVLDSSAGTGALLFSAIERGCSNVCGIEYDGEVYKKLKDNLSKTDINYDILNADASSEEAYEWIKSKSITKAILNPPYEKKYNSSGIVLNTLNALPSGCLVAMFHQTNFFDKLKKKEKEEMSRHRIEKVINMPINLFQPFVSVATAIYIIRTGTPQDDYKFYGYEIKDDGLTRQKGKYRADKSGVWEKALEPKFYEIISNEKEDEISTRQDVSNGIHYQQKIDMNPTEEDFRRTIDGYLEYKLDNFFRSGNGPKLSPCQVKLAALSYYVGAENVYDCLDNPEKYFGSKE